MDTVARRRPGLVLMVVVSAPTARCTASPYCFRPCATAGSPVDKEPLARDLVRRLYANFFTTFFDAEHGLIIVRDAERDTIPGHTTRMANFDAARYLSQWSRLAKTIGGDLEGRETCQQACRSAVSSPSISLLARNKACSRIRILPSGLHIILPLVSVGFTPLQLTRWPSRTCRASLTGRPTSQTSPFIPEFTIAGKVLHAFLLREERPGRHGYQGRHLPLPLRPA